MWPFESLCFAMNVLDFGCGLGGFAQRILPFVYSLDVVEPEAALADRLKNLLANKGRQYQSMVDVDKQYDAISAFHVLEHLPDPVQTLIQFKRCLKPGGKIILEVPHANDALLTLYENTGFQAFTYWSCHLYLFNSYSFQQMAKKAGLGGTVRL